MNFFLPQAKLLAKERIGSKTIKKHDRPHTPLERLLAHPSISPKVKRQLQKQLSTLDPFFLQKQINGKIKMILRLASPLPRMSSIVATVPEKTYHIA